MKKYGEAIDSTRLMKTVVGRQEVIKSVHKNHLKRPLFKRRLLYLPLICLFLLLLSYAVYEPNWSFKLVTGLAGISALYSIYLCVITGPNRINFAVVYIVYLSIAHLGLVLSDVLIQDSLFSFYENVGLNYGHLRWFYSEPSITKLAVCLSGIAVSSLALVAGVVSRSSAEKGPKVPNLERKGNKVIFFIGVVLLALCSVYFILMIVTGKIPLFESYADFRMSIEDSFGYSLFLVFLATGLPFVLATGSKKQIMKWIVFFAIPGVLLAFSGNRGEVLYPGAAAVAVIGFRGFKIKAREISIILVILFIIIPGIRQIRQRGLRQLEFEKITIALTDPFVEIGSQIRPLTESIRWIKSGEEYGYGGSYLLPVKRLIGLFIHWIERPSIENSRFDLRGRTPAQGYTVIGEAFFNYGVAGVVIIPGLIGFYLSRYANHANTSRLLAIHGAVLATLINNIRNSFIFVPGHLAIITALAVISYLLTKRRFEEV